MSVLIETTEGNIVVDLHLDKYSVECYNFLKLSRSGFYNYQCFHNVQKNYLVEFGDALYGFNDRTDINLHSTSIQGIMKDGNVIPKFIISSSDTTTTNGSYGDVGFICSGLNSNLIGSKIMISLAPHLINYKGTVIFGKITEGLHTTLHRINNCILDNDRRPEVDIRIKKIHIIHDPFDELDIQEFKPPIPMKEIRLPSPSIQSQEKSIQEEISRKEIVLEIFGDIEKAGIKPAENVLFVCKLNPITRAKDIAQIFSRFGAILSVEIVRDKVLGYSLGYGFIEFNSKHSCEQAYSKMQNVMIDDRKIHVDFSQSSKSKRKKLRKYK